MADTYTTNLNLTKPEPGAAEDTWGISLNADLDSLDAIFSSSGTQINLNPNQINFADNKKAIFGTGNDLQIYHDGSNSIIQDSGAGNLQLRGASFVIMQSDDGENMVRGQKNAGVRLYYDGATKLDTTSTGIDVTGTVTSDGLTVEAGIAQLQLIDTGVSGSTKLRTANAQTWLEIDPDNVQASSGFATYIDGKRFFNIEDTGDISFYDDTGTSQNLKWDASADTLNFVDNAKAQFGTDNDLQIYHSGSNSIIRDVGTGDLRIQGANLQLLSSNGKKYLFGVEDAYTKLYYNNAEKLATTNTGIDVTGTAVADNLHIDNTSGQLKISRVGSSGNGIYWDRLGTQDAAIQVASNEQLNIDNNFGNPINLRIGADGSETTYLSVNTSGIAVTGNNLDHTALSPQYNMIESDITGNNTQFLQVGGDLRIRTIDDSKANPVERLRIDHASGDISFYDNTGSTQGLFWDASTERLGLGTTSPSTALHVVGTITADTHFTSSDTNTTLSTSGSGGTVRLRPNGLSSTTGQVTVVSSGNVGIGTDSPAQNLTIEKTVTSGDGATALLGVFAKGGAAGEDAEIYIGQNQSRAAKIVAHKKGTGNDHDLSFSTNASAATPTEKMRILANGNVGIGTDSPLHQLVIGANSTQVLKSTVAITDMTNGASLSLRGQAPTIFFDSTSAGIPTILMDGRGIEFKDGTLDSQGSVNVKIDSSGNLLVGTTDTSLWNNGAGGNTGTVIESDGTIQLAKSNNATAYFNRLDSDGDIVSFRKNGSTVGSIGNNGSRLFAGSGATGLMYDGANNYIVPWNTSTNTGRDGAIDLGVSPFRFKDLHLSGTANVGAINITGSGTSTFGGAITVQGNITTDGGDFKVGTNTVISSARAVDNVVSVTSSGNIQSTGGAFKWNVDGSGYHYLGTDIFDGLLMMSRADETIKFGSGETVSTTDAFQFWTSTTSTSNLGSKVFSITSGGTANFTGSVGIGTSSPSAVLTVDGTTKTFGDSGITLKRTGSVTGEADIILAGVSGSEALSFRVNNSEKFRVQNNGYFGIGTSSPVAPLHISNTYPVIRLTDSDGAAPYAQIINSSGLLQLRADDNNSTANSAIQFFVDGGGEKARIDLSGNLLVGTTSADFNSYAGFRVKPAGNVYATTENDSPALFNRRSSDGNIITLRKDGSTVGVVGTSATDLFIGTGVAGLRFREAGSQLMPWNTTTNAANDSAIDIGKSDAKFKDLYLSGNIRFGDSAPAELYTNSSELRLGVDRNNDNGTSNITFYVNNSETARIDSSGRLIVGGTSAGQTGATTIYPNGNIASSSITATGDGVFNFFKTETFNPVLTANDSQSDTGQIIAVQIGGTTKGNIGINSATGNDMYIASGTTSSAGVGLRFIDYQVTNIQPCRGNGSTLDNVIDLGSVGARFDDIYATNGTIQTSDENEKQDIQALTDAEQRVATACKGLIRRFRWQDSVAEKDDNPESDETARYHFGVIAQDLQDAFTAEGLNASDYGMFISSTWTDDDGVEQTRLGVRYNELLAFIITTL